MSSGKVDIRTMKRTDKARLRFYGVAPDQLETILHALEFAKEHSSTKFDTVALEFICLNFLEGMCGKPKSKKTQS